MTVGKADYAIRKALDLFDAWNDVTGAIGKFSSYYYEIQGCIEDAVRIGIMVANGIDIEIDKDGQLLNKTKE